MASRTARKGTSRYKIRNWKQYEAGLIQRGSISFWINDDAIDQGVVAQRCFGIGSPILLDFYLILTESDIPNRVI